MRLSGLASAIPWRSGRVPIIACLLAGSLAACGGNKASGEAAQSGGAFKVALSVEPTTLDAIKAHAEPGMMVIRQTSEPLVQRNGQGKPIPILAASLPQPVDKLTWKVDLRQGVKFSDGSPFTADDVAASFAKLDESIKAGSTGFATHFLGSPLAKAVNDHEVLITTKTPVPSLIAELQNLLIQKQSANNDSAPVGTGPYVLDKWDRGQGITLSANPHYWGSKPRWKTVAFRFLPDPGARIASLKSGETDMSIDLSPADTKSVPNYLVTHDSNIFYGFYPNTRDGLFTDVRLRQALAYALDNKSMLDSLFDGFGQVEPCQAALDSYIGFNPSLKPYPYDVNRAKQLVQAAGATGKSFEVVGSRGYFPGDAEMAEAAVGYWEAIGLKPKLTLLPLDQYIARITDQKHRKADVAIAYIIARDFDPSNIWHVYVGSDSPASSNSDGTLDAQMKRASELVDPTQQNAAYQEPVKRICDQASMVFTVQQSLIYGARKGLKFADGNGPETGYYLLSVDDVESK